MLRLRKFAHPTTAGFSQVSLVFRKAVCRNPEYNLGKEYWILPGSNNCIPGGWKVGYRLKPTDCTRTRGHVQVVANEIDFVLRSLNRVDSAALPEYEMLGNNNVNTTCTCAAGFAHAIENRQRICIASGPSVKRGRPWLVADRHLKGYRKSQRELTSKLWKIACASGRELQTLKQKASKYSGTKRVHYEKCAEELSAHPLKMKERARIFHDGSVKWGELSDRPRALLVQSVRARGTNNVKTGELLRAPILVEGRYRDFEEDALHKFMHADGHHYTASGMNLHKRARKITKMIAPGDVVLSCDWSSFDGSLGQIGVEEREAFFDYATRHLGYDEQLKTVIATQNKATFQAGPISGQLYGNRGSGTAGTSTGNKKVVLAALFYCLGPALIGKGSVKLFCDGDDTLIIVPKQWQGENNYKSWVRRMTELGLETKLEQVLVDTPEQPAVERVRFCRAGVIQTARGPLLCKVPQDAIKVATNFRRHFRGTRFRDYCQTLSVSYAGTYGDVPILCKLGPLFDVGGNVDLGLLESSGIEYMMSKTTTTAGEITLDHRWSFYRTWGVSPNLQIQCEAALDELALKLRPLLVEANF